MWRFKRLQDEKIDAFNNQWEQTRSLLCLYANVHRNANTPPLKPEDFVRLSYDKTDTQVNLHDNPLLLEEFKKRFKFKGRKKRG